MRAWLLEGFDGLKDMRLGEIADPTAGEGEVVLRVHYAALNPADRYLSEGQYPAKPPLPHILGRDGIGDVVQVAGGVTNWKIGDRALILRGDVGVNRHGTLAEKVAVPVALLTKVPAKWSEQEAAGGPLVYLTAYQALTQWGELPPSVVLVTGASGGVGVATVQLGKVMGHRVIGLSRSHAKRQTLLDLGASAMLDPTDSEWPKELRDLLDGKRVDLAIDNIGGPMFNDVLSVLGDNGKVACVGRLAGPVPQFNTASLFFRRINIRGVFVGAYKPPEAQAAWNSIVQLLDRAGAKPVVDSVHPFERVFDAFARLEKGPLGKVLVAVTALVTT